MSASVKSWRRISFRPRSKSHAHRNLARPICGSGPKEAAKVGARSQQDESRQEHGFIHLLDYKPNAATIDPVNQLIVYALALAARTQLPVKTFKCAWFDEKDYFEFFPLQAVWPKTAGRMESGESFK